VNTSISDELKKELLARGFSTSLEAPNGTMGLTSAYTTAAELADLMDLMVSRREKIFRSVDVVGHDAASVVSPTWRALEPRNTALTGDLRRKGFLETPH
jgi:hypothetical protein